MSESTPAPARADARRNRELLLRTAAEAFAAADGPVSLEAVARSAGVGIGTLYRHFPNREALVEAVYRAELAEVSAAAAELLRRNPPVVALRRWMERYARFVAAKQGMAESLRAVLDSGSVSRSRTRADIIGAVESLLAAGVDEGSLRADVRAEDVVTGLLGISLAATSEEQRRRLLALLVDGLVATRGPVAGGQ